MARFPLFALLGTALLGLCACSDPKDDESRYAVPRRHFTDPAGQAYGDTQFAVYDPAEGVNKQVYKFNAEFDRYVFLPIVNGYVYVTPEFFRTGVSNFFLNVGEVTNFTNAVFQIQPKKAGITIARFAVNTTAGLLGTIDVATKIGLNRQPEDFGETLGYWGAGAGAYVVLPILGPSNVRDTLGTVVDYATLSIIIPHSVKETVPYDVIAYGLEPVNLRYTNPFRYYASGSPFEYELVRYIISQARSAAIEKLKTPAAQAPVAQTPAAQ